jgi:hypothetical protein
MARIPNINTNIFLIKRTNKHPQGHKLYKIRFLEPFKLKRNVITPISVININHVLL